MTSRLHASCLVSLLFCLGGVPPAALADPNPCSAPTEVESIPSDATFAADTTLSAEVRAEIARSAKRMGALQEGRPSQLLIPGTFSADELPPRAEGEWYAMTIAGGNASFVPVQVRVTRAANPRATGDLSIPGARVEADVRDSILFMVRGGGWTRRAAVSTWFLGGARFSPGSKISFEDAAAAKRWSISSSQKMRSRVRETPSFQVSVHDRTTRRFQNLGTWQLGVTPEIQWVGDLDGDGRLDMFVRDHSDESGSRYWTLYLSSRATRGSPLFGKAAEFYTPGC